MGMGMGMDVEKDRGGRGATEGSWKGEGAKGGGEWGAQGGGE